ncbi:MAG: hypothetical protein PHE89_06485 [Alphaproteobacteria bacterium]|nr:hypothetical protein [Alphaproteobacteria bacterium]
MFQKRLTKKILMTTAMAAMLSSCGMFKQNAEYSSTTNWFLGISNEELGNEEAQKATLSYSQGNFAIAEKHFLKALSDNPKNQQALMVGALTYEKEGKLNKARAYYEDIIIIGGDKTTVLGTTDGLPHKMTEVAQQRLRNITLTQTQIIVEDKFGNKTFKISQEIADKQGKSAMEEALFLRSEKIEFNNKATAEANLKAVEILFDDNEKNVISRFLILKELAEKDMVTKEEFLAARNQNLGGLLPLSNKAPALGIGEPVPSADVVLDRIDALKLGVEERAISPKEFSAERDMIVDAILPANPRERAKNKAPSRDILGAAKDLRKLEVIAELGLITPKEKEAEQRAIERAVKTSSAAKPTPKKAPTKPQKPTAPKPLVSVPQTQAQASATAPEPAPAEKKPFIEKKVEIKGTMREFPGDPNVSSPF